MKSINKIVKALLGGGLILLLLPMSVLGNGGAHLDYTIQQFSNGVWCTGIHLADIDYDGAPEILIGNRNVSSVEIWKYDPGIDTLSLIDTIGFPYHIHDIKAADFDNDGDQDVVVGLRTYGLYLATNIGSPGTVGNWNIRQLDSRYSWQVLVADFDGDGYLDISDGVDYGPIKMFYGDGTGNFTQGTPVQDPTTSMRFPRGFDAIDLDSDGLLDLIGADGSFMRAFLNPGNRSAPWASVGPFTPFGDYPCCPNLELQANVSSSAADLDGNGFIDQVAFLGSPSHVESHVIEAIVNFIDQVVFLGSLSSRAPCEALVFEGRSSGSNLLWTKRTLDTVIDPGFAGHAGVADLDDDGHLDVSVGGYWWFNSLRVYLGDSTGSFTLETVALDHGVGDLNSFEAGDINGDGATDIVTVRYAGSRYSGFEVLFRKVPVIEIPIDIKPGSDPNSINLCSHGVVSVAILTEGDFDATTIDPASVELAGASVAIIRGKGVLRYSHEDVDRDGDLDFIAHIPVENLELDGGSTEATVSGSADGVRFEGTDSVNIVKDCQ